MTKAFAEKPGEIYEEILDAWKSIAYIRKVVESMLYIPRNAPESAPGKLMARAEANALETCLGSKAIMSMPPQLQHDFLGRFVETLISGLPLLRGIESE
ncbi:MAG: hypothetical protein Q9184_004464 [Pyrenodesmia sp. 2 TL-2023]